MADRLFAALFAVVAALMLAAWPGWRMDEAPAGYAQEPHDFLERVEAFAGGRDVVRPPPGDVPLLARRFEFWPALELKAGQTYRLHVGSVDGVHALALDGRETLLVPGRVQVFEVTPAAPGPLDLRCNEYCGLGHNKMRGAVTVIP